jgi:hypothetical protein
MKGVIVIKWTKRFTNREIKEIDFARIYTDNFNHGTDGHRAKIIISKMSNMLNATHAVLTDPALSGADKIDKIERLMGLEKANEDRE